MKKQLLTLASLVALATSTFAQFSGGTGTKPDPYLIASKNDLLTLSTNSGYWSNHFKQTDNINFSSADFATGGAFYNAGKGFRTIGNSSTYFTGSYNGQGFSIDSLKITRTILDINGFFGVVNSPDTIKNIAITNCSIQGKDFTGGLVGYNIYGYISNSYATGLVSGSHYVGGLVGFYETGTIYNSYSTSTVSGNYEIGGLVGYNLNGTISNSYSTGLVGGNNDVGGLVGFNSGGSVTNSFWDTQTSGQGTSAGGTGKTTTEMKTQSTFTGWDFTNVWSMGDCNVDGSYPKLRNEKLFSGGAGTVSDPYQIATVYDLDRLSKNNCFWDKHFVQTADIDDENTQIWAVGGGNPGFSPIGNYTTNFTGTYNGANFKIKGVKIFRPDNYIGLFGYSSGNISNIRDAIIRVYDAGNIVGGLVAFNSGSISNCSVVVDISDQSPSPTPIDSLGALVGFNSATGSISNCYSDGAVSGGEYVGGMIGFNRGAISNSYSKTSVSGTANKAGFIGINYGTISNCYSNSNSSLGFIGYNEYPLNVTNCFFEGTDNSQGGTLKTNAQMSEEATFTGATWDFVGETTIGTADIWKMGICSNEGFPVFSWQAISPLPSITSFTPPSRCGTGTLVIDPTFIGDGIEWYDAETGGNYVDYSELGTPFTTPSISTTTTYWAQIYSGECVSERIPVIASINTPNSGTDIQTACGSYLWIDGNTYTSHNNTATHVLTNVGGCDSTVTLNLTIENPIDITTSANAETITANATGATYQWIDCNNSNLPIAGETNQSFTATANGNYAVVITQGLCSDTSACVPITTVGLKSEINNHTSAIKIMPNPSTGVFNIELQQNSTITITDALGRTILTQQLNSGNHKLDLVNQSNGVYFININNTSNYKIIKQN